MDSQNDLFDGFTKELPKELQTRLDLIIQTIPTFWEQKRYDHFTNHGQAHSESIHRQKLAQLAQELPQSQRLNTEEVFIVSAAAWLYDTGMQSPNLRPILNFDWRPGDVLSSQQLQEIREKKHLLTEQLIYDSVSDFYKGIPINLGLIRPKDDYTNLIAEVCRWCSDDPLDEVPDKLPIKGGIPIRVRLLVALLRLADQLYIDNSRVNLDLLIERSKLPIRQVARWWAYHYAQTQPIVNGQIRFHYFMPDSQKEYLGLIRALIEPEFEIDKNPTIRYLWDKYQLRLMPQKVPTARFDRQTGFRRLMSRDLLWTLRQEVLPMDTPKELFVEEIPLERSMLILDYENFILQFGQEGHFFTNDEIGQAAISLLKEASDQSLGPVDAIAIGHWDRPDLRLIAKELKENVYEVVNIKQEETPLGKLETAIDSALSSSSPPRHITLVAPAKGLASFTKNELSDKGMAVSAWITKLPEARIYQAVVNKCRSLNEILSLQDKSGMEPGQLEYYQSICIFRLKTELLESKDGYIPYEKACRILEKIDGIPGTSDWWALWLFNNKIISASTTGSAFFVQLNHENPEILRLFRMQKAVSTVIPKLPQVSGGAREDQLLKQLLHHEDFKNDTTTLRFLEVLKGEGVVLRLPPSYFTENQPIWQLDPSVSIDVERYLPQFILAADHFMVREGYRFIHENSLPNRLKSLFPETVIAIVYKTALNHNWIKLQDTGEKFRGSDNPILGVSLVDEKYEVAEILRNRDILIYLLYKQGENGILREALWQQLSKNRSFTVIRDDFDLWLDYFEKDSIVFISKHLNDSSQDLIKLDNKKPLAQRILGRFYICGVVTTFRISKATRAEAKKPEREMKEKLALFVTHHNAQLADWTLEYAKTIKLIKEEQGSIYLNTHSLVKNLDRREISNCQLIVNFVKKIGSGEWVNRNAVFQEMEKNTQFGYSRGEHEYWINTAIHRQKLLEEKRESQRNFIIHQVRPVKK